MAPWNRLRHFFILLFCLLIATTNAAREAQYPPLFTSDFGSCLAGPSPLQITTFDLAYDSGNRTLVLHLNGTSSLEKESLMFRIFIDAYGTALFNTMVDPCSLNMTSLCPTSSNIPIAAQGVISVGDRRIEEVLDTDAYRFPDFEGLARLQIYANSTKTEIGCFQAIMSNGKTLSHPEIIAPVLGFFTVVAILASFLTAAYGVSIPHMRTHHAHSLSVMVVFETLQAVFFSGALSIKWPSNLVAWWSNFAWSTGLIHIPGLTHSINTFTKVSGSSAIFGSQIFGRSTAEEPADAASQLVLYNSSFLHDYRWSGNPVDAGLPLPGTGFGFSEVLAVRHIPIDDAFLVALIWLLIAVGLVILGIVGLKMSLECLGRAKKIKEDRLAYFRSHWAGYLGHAMLRTLAIAFFMLMTFAMLQLNIRVTVGPVAVATIVFILLVIGGIVLVASGCRARLRDGKTEIRSDRIVFYRTKILGPLPGIATAWESTLNEHEAEVQPLFSIPFFRIRHINHDPDRDTVHLDQSFVKRFGWLTARYRRRRWWFLAYHVAYLICRAAFLGGGLHSPRVQVYGVLVADIVNFAIAVLLNPFEGSRNTAMAVWMLSICKIVTAGVSVAYLPEFKIDRINAAKLGGVIIVLQGLTVIALLILIAISSYSSWMSLTRNRPVFDPDWLEPVRIRYFEDMEKKAADRGKFEPEPPKPVTPPPHFSVVSIQRRPKIEDEDSDLNAVHEQYESHDDASTTTELPTAGDPNRHSRTSSIGPRLSTGSLPRAARPYRASWSSRDFGDAALSRPDSVLTQRLSGVTYVVVTDCDASNTSSTALVRPQSSLWSLNTPSVSRASSPSLGRPSRESVTHADGRRPPTALPEAPEPQE
ncbi:hypothetical protein VTI74DRAFT_769 [Chaetomium olivicolor]